MGTLPLRELARPGQTVAISVCDITRPMPSSRVLPVLLAELEHVPRDRISILVATGTHRSNTVEELEGMLGAEVVRNYPVINHRSFRPQTLGYRGTLPSGIPVWLNSIWLESDVRITTGFVEPHFFAGFSGGPKLVAPGLAGFDTIMKLHSAPLIAHPQATWGITHGNPIHDAIREVATLSGVDFSLDVTLNRDHEISSVHAGEIFESHGSACRFAQKTAMQPVARPFDVVVTTNSGYPLDLNLYQSVKGMSAAARIVRRGGAIVCAAECSDGIPEHGEYRKLLASTADPASFLDRIQREDVTTHDQWQVQIQSQIQLKARVLLKSGGLTPRQIRSAHLEPVGDLEATVLELLDEYGPDARLGVLPQGPQTIPYLSPAG
jgi:nickel-dependent lactate racemase